MFKIVPSSAFVNPSTHAAINKVLKNEGAYDAEFETYEEAEGFRKEANIADFATEIEEV